MPLGGYIGYDAEPTTDAAPGIWRLREAEFYKRKAQWPLLFVPSDITGLQLWLDASDASTLYDATTGGSLVAADGGVARWEDKSGNDRHATQGTSGSRPLRKASVQNGLDGLRFDGSDDTLSIASSTATFKFLHSTQATAFLVSKPEPSVDDSAAMCAIGTFNISTSNIGYALLYEDREFPSETPPFIAEDELRCIIARGAGGTVTVDTLGSGNGLFSAGVYSVAAATTDCAAASGNDRISVLINKADQGPTNSDTNAASTSNSTSNFHVGSAAGNSFFWDGDICEIIIYNSALSDTDREAVEDYLLGKWAIT